MDRGQRHHPPGGEHWRQRHHRRRLRGRQGHPLQLHRRRKPMQGGEKIG